MILGFIISLLVSCVLFELMDRYTDWPNWVQWVIVLLILFILF